MTTDVVFISPSYKPILRHESIGTLILAKKLELAGYSVKIVRFWEVNKGIYHEFIDVIRNKILAEKPKMVCFYCREAEYHIMLDLAHNLKNSNPQLVIVFGGPQAELTAEDTLTTFSWVDYICCGEGESTIVQLADLVSGNFDYLSRVDIRGLVYRNENNCIIKNKLPELLKDNYKHDYDYYYDLIPQNIKKNSNSISIDVGRGCPYMCTFCSTKTFWKRKFRLRDINDTIKEIEYVKQNLGNKVFSFNHDLFTANKHRVSDFCDNIANLGKQIKWTCSSRIDSVDFQTIDTMVNSGLIAIFFGVETGSKRLQRLIKKNLKIEQCYDIIRYSVSKGLSVTASFIYGFPDETYEDLEDSLMLIHKLLTIGANIQLHKLCFERGSELYDKYKRNLIFNSVACNSVFGAKDSIDMIQNNLQIFPNFGEYPSKLRKEMKNLAMLHSICKDHHKAYVTLLNILSKKTNYVDIYRFLLNTVGNSLDTYEMKGIQVSKSIGCFLFEKILANVTSEVGIKTFSLNKSDIEQLHCQS